MQKNYESTFGKGKPGRDPWELVASYEDGDVSMINVWASGPDEVFRLALVLLAPRDARCTGMVARNRYKEWKPGSKT